MATSSILGRHYNIFKYDDLVASGKVEPGEALFFLQDKEWERYRDMAYKKVTKKVPTPKQTVLKDVPADVCDADKDQVASQPSEFDYLQKRVAQLENHMYAPKQAVYEPKHVSVTTERLKAESERAYRYANLLEIAKAAAERYPSLEKFIIVPSFNNFEAKEGSYI